MDEVTGLESTTKELQDRYKPSEFGAGSTGNHHGMTQRLGFRDDYDRFYNLFVRMYSGRFRSLPLIV